MGKVSMSLSIIIPFYGEPEQLIPVCRCTESYPIGADIIVVDDGCEVSPKSIIAAHGRPLTTLITMPPPKVPWNLPACVNRAAEIARGRYILILPADHTLDAPCYYVLLDWCEQDGGRNVGQLSRRGHAPGCGILCIPTDHYLAIGGMDEQYCGNYGYGGNDLRRRLALPIVTVPGVVIDYDMRGEIQDGVMTRDPRINAAKFAAGPRQLKPLERRHVQP